MAARFVPTRQDPPIQVLAAPAAERLAPSVRLWRTLACCVLMARTNRAAAMPVWPVLFDRYPTADAVDAQDRGSGTDAVVHELAAILEPLGFQHRRADMLVRLAGALTSTGEYSGARGRLDALVLSGALGVESLPGCGAYAREAFDLFVAGRFDRIPVDHVLAAWRALVMDGATDVRHDRGGRQARPTRGVNDHKETSAMSATTAVPNAGPKITQRVLDALTDHGPAVNGEPWDKHLTPEQTARAFEAVKAKRGLRGKALSDWILTGDGVAAQAAKAPKPEKTVTPRARAARKSAYPDDIRQAVQRVYELMGKSHGPGPKQHVAVRKAIGTRDPVDATGFASLAKLTKFAKGEGGKLNEQTEKVREAMAQLFKDAGADPFARGKHLACIVVAYAEQRKKA